MSNPQMFSVPFKCKDYADYKRALEVAELLNTSNNDYPIIVSLGSGPKDPNQEGVRYCDVQCGSGAKIQHFMELGQVLDEDIRKLNQDIKLKVPKFDQVDPNKMFADLFTSDLEAALTRLTEQQNRIRKLKGKEEY